MFPTTSRSATIRSNPPIRVGKNELHGLLEQWIPRLDERSDAWLVVQRNLGSDSLQRWLAAILHAGLQRAPRGDGTRVPRAQGAPARFAPDERDRAALNPTERRGGRRGPLQASATSPE